MDQVEEIKQRIDIVDLVGSYIELKKAGVSYKALCPFHNEKTPSFIVSSDRGTFKCFGCGEFGDIFTFVEKMEGVDFPEALKILAEKAGVKLERVEKQFYDQKRALYEINNQASEVFHHLLIKDKIGQKPLDYLKKRGLNKKTIESFKIGYAPQNYEFLSRYLLKKGFKENDLVISGLSLRRDRVVKGRFPLFDRFRGRVMFPLFNPAGNVIAFSGRLLEEQEGVGKYINSPETPIFSKSRVIFALDKAKAAIRKNGAVILVEGQMDVLMSHQAGFANTVASSGTALTFEQIKILNRLSRSFLFAFDADNAGIEATKKGVGLVLAQSGDVLVIDTPAGFKDSAEVIKKDPSLWQKAVVEAVPFLDYLEEKVFVKFNAELSPQDKRDIALEILPWIAKISDPIVAGDYIGRLSSRLGVQEKYLFEAMERMRTKSQIPSSKSQTNPKNLNSKIQSHSRENHLLGLLLVFPQYFTSIKELLSPTDFSSEQVTTIYKKMIKEYASRRKFNLKKFISNLASSKRDFVNLIILDVENEYAEEDEELAGEEIRLLVERIRQKNKDKVLVDFEQKIKEAEKLGNKEKIKKLIREFQNSVIQGKK